MVDSVTSCLIDGAEDDHVSSSVVGAILFSVVESTPVVESTRVVEVDVEFEVQDVEFEVDVIVVVVSGVVGVVTEGSIVVVVAGSSARFHQHEAQQGISSHPCT